MIPYASFLYFGLLLLLVVLPSIALGLKGRANARWALLARVVICVIQFSNGVAIRPDFLVREIWIVLGYGAWQWLLAWALLRLKSRLAFYVTFALALLPLLLAKFLPAFAPGSEFGFVGISYVSFRALDVIFSVRDGVIKTLSLPQYVTFLFFFPTISSGPIDRYRRFAQDWQRTRSRAEFLDDLDLAVERIFRGFLYKFIIAALLRTHWVDRFQHSNALDLLAYMYGYSLYLFFDFAGYSSFAIGFSYLLGVRSPKNFHLPFLARNIRDFWTRWHISLSFWFRDHVYMRFVLTAAKGKWFRGKHTASYLGLFLTFGLMGVWHGIEPHYLIYGLYHAALLCGYDAFARWNKQSKWWGAGGAWHGLNIFLTVHAVCFGLLIFSGGLGHAPPPFEKTKRAASAPE